MRPRIDASLLALQQARAMLRPQSLLLAGVAGAPLRFDAAGNQLAFSLCAVTALRMLSNDEVQT